jgi:hypothetical protein
MIVNLSLGSVNAAESSQKAHSASLPSGRPCGLHGTDELGVSHFDHSEGGGYFSSTSITRITLLPGLATM